MTEEKNPTILLLMVQRYRTAKGDEGRIYYEITRDELETGKMDMATVEGRERFYSGKNAIKYMGGSAGIVYEVEAKGASVFPGTARYVGMWPDREKRAEWQLVDKVEGQKIALAKEHKKAKREDAVLECLEPIRLAYRNARGARRSLILARAVQYITR